MNRHRNDAGTLGYIIVHKRESDGLPLLSKALPSVSDMDPHRQKWPDGDVALYLTEEKALSAWESLAEDVRGRTEVRAVLVYYTETVVKSIENVPLEERVRLIKKETSRLVYQRNKLSAVLEGKERDLAEVRRQLPHAEAEDSPEMLRVLRDKETELVAAIAQLQEDHDMVAPLCEQAKEAQLAIQAMLQTNQDRDELLAARASAREAVRHIKAVLGDDFYVVGEPERVGRVPVRTELTPEGSS